MSLRVGGVPQVLCVPVPASLLAKLLARATACPSTYCAQVVKEIGNLLPNNRRQRCTCYALCNILYPVSAALTCSHSTLKCGVAPSISPDGSSNDRFRRKPSCPEPYSFTALAASAKLVPCVRRLTHQGSGVRVQGVGVRVRV